MTIKNRFSGYSWIASAMASLLLALFSASMASAQITVSRSTLSFAVPKYVTSPSLPIIVTNIGTAPAVLGQISYSGAYAGDFSSAFDACSQHELFAGRSCRIQVQFSPSAAMGTKETATLSINNTTGGSYATVTLKGLVSKGPVNASLSGLTVTLNDVTLNDYQMDFTITGPYSDTGTGTCTDVVFQNSSCTIILQQNSSGTGEIKITMAPLGGGASGVFNIPLT